MNNSRFFIEVYISQYMVNNCLIPVISADNICYVFSSMDVNDYDVTDNKNMHLKVFDEKH